jgi:UDP-glucose 4-epimerase
MKRRKILILGGLGFVGSNLAKRLVEIGEDVTIYDNLDPNSGGNIHNIDEFKNKITLCLEDILNLKTLREKIIDNDIIYNCAASTSHPFSMKEPLLDLDVNSKAVLNILNIIKKYNSKVKFIHIGTSTQLGKLLYSPADESHAEFPTDIYSANKSVSEKYVLIYANAFGLDCSVFRLPNIFGPRASIHSPDFTFNNFFIGLALQNKPITIYGNGNQKRNLIYIDDVVEALLAASNSSLTRGEVFFVSSDNHFSVSDIAMKISKHIGNVDVKHIDWPKNRKAIEIGDAILTNKKIKKILKWNPKVSFEEGLVKTKMFYFDKLKYYLK